MSELIFFTGPMAAGKSSLALQLAYSRKAQGHKGLLFTKNSREGKGVVVSRIGISAEAIEIEDDTDLYDVVESHDGYYDEPALSFVIVDEAQFLSPEQVDQLAWVVDDLRISVYATGLLTDFRSELFPGSKRLVELADRVDKVQADAVCWCGKTGQMNARVVGGLMTKEGPQVVVGDTSGLDPVNYAVVCREHYTMGVVATHV